MNSDAAASVGATLDPRADSLRRQRRRPVLCTPWTAGLRGMSTASTQEEEVRPRRSCRSGVDYVLCVVDMGFCLGVGWFGFGRVA